MTQSIIFFVACAVSALIGWVANDMRHEARIDELEREVMEQRARIHRLARTEP